MPKSAKRFPKVKKKKRKAKECQKKGLKNSSVCQKIRGKKCQKVQRSAQKCKNIEEEKVSKMAKKFHKVAKSAIM